ncbi:maltodextrin-binding protein MdxE precursor [mine drainage metagenome]|uniref:Maltodextrin-binding protein MdxE n=1 Tax=mine drainage metagenome TaxID=410659 RepID=A0A1J5QBG8_9ZZZZ
MTSLKRRIVVASSTLSMFLGVLMAPSAHASTAVVLWADDSKAPSYQAIATEYTAKTGVAVTVVVKPKLKDDLKTVQDADAPDVIIAAHDWIGGLRADNQIVDIRLSNAKEFGASTLGAFSLGSKLFGVPLQTENIALFRNTKLVPKAPKTFAQLETIALALKKKNAKNANFVPFAVQQGTGGDAYHMFPLFTGLGGYLFGGTPGKWNPYDVGVDNKKFLKNAPLIDKWYKEGLIKASVSGDIAKNAFTSGNAPFYVTGPWNLADIRKSGVHYAISSVPQIVKGINPVPFSGVQGAMLTTWADKHGVTLSAKDFLNYLATAPVQLELATALLRAPANLKALAKYSDKDMAAFGIAGANAIPMPSIPAMNAVWGAVGGAWVKATSGQSKAVAAFKAAAKSMRDNIE